MISKCKVKSTIIGLIAISILLPSSAFSQVPGGDPGAELPAPTDMMPDAPGNANDYKFQRGQRWKQRRLENQDGASNLGAGQGFGQGTFAGRGAGGAAFAGKGFGGGRAGRGFAGRGLGGGGFAGKGFAGVAGRQIDLTPLNLTEQQKEKIQQSREQTRTKVKEVRQSLMQKQTEMRNLMFSPDASEAQIRKARKDMRQYQDQIDELTLGDLLSIRSVLTDEQRKHLPEILPHRQGQGPGSRMDIERDAASDVAPRRN